HMPPRHGIMTKKALNIGTTVIEPLPLFITDGIGVYLCRADFGEVSTRLYRIAARLRRAFNAERCNRKAGRETEGIELAHSDSPVKIGHRLLPVARGFGKESSKLTQSC